MADAHERGVVETMCAHNHARDNESQLQLVRVKHLFKTEQVEVDHCLTVEKEGEQQRQQPLAKENLLQQVEQVFGGISMSKYHYSRRPSRLSYDNERETAGASLIQEKGSDETGTKDERGHDERLAAEEEEEEAFPEGIHGDADKVLVKRRTGQNRTLLLPTRDSSTDGGSIQESRNTSITIDGRSVRISSDSLCSPTAFSVAATAASLTCNSPPSCTSLGDRHTLSKTSSESDATGRAEDLQRQNAMLLLPQPQATSLSETHLRAVELLHQEKTLDSLQLHEPRREQQDHPVEVKRVQTTQRQECEVHRRQHNESHSGGYKVICSRPDHLLGSACLQADAEKSNGDEEYEQDKCSASPHFAAVAGRSEERYITNEASRFIQVSLKAAKGSVSNTASNWAPSAASGESLQNHHVSARDAQRGAPEVRSATAGENEAKALVTTTTATVTAGLRTTASASDQKSSTTATTHRSRSSRLPWADVDFASQRFSVPSAEADMSCSQSDIPACCFCSSTTDIVFPPPPAPLVAQFIAYVFEPQLQRLRRRLRGDSRQRLWSESLRNCNGEEDAKTSNEVSSSTARVSTSSSTASGVVAAAGTSDAAYPECTKAYARDTLPDHPESLFTHCSLQDEQSKRRACCVSQSATRADGGYICNSLVDQGAGKDASDKVTGGAVHADCKAGDSAPISVPCPTLLTPTSFPNCSSTASACRMCTAHSAAAKSGSNVDPATLTTSNIATALERRHESALLALQLKHHLVNLVCYMERLLKRSRSLRRDSSVAWVTRPRNDTISSSEEDCGRSKDNEDPTTTNSRGHGKSNQFSFHIEQLLRAEIMVQPMVPFVSQEKCKWEFPARSDRGANILHLSDAAKTHSRCAKACTLARHSDEIVDAMRADDPAVSKTSPGGAVQSRIVESQKMRQTSEEDTHACAMFPTEEAHKSRVHPTKDAAGELETTAEPGVEGPSDKDTQMNSNGGVNSNGGREDIADPAFEFLVQQQVPKKVTESSPLRGTARPMGIFITDELLPRAPEDIVLQGAPPSMINYLIVFSPLLVLQALQQTVKHSMGEDSKDCDSTTTGEVQLVSKESKQGAEKPDEELSQDIPNLDSSNTRRLSVEHITCQNSCTSKKSMPDIVVSQKSPRLTTELPTNRASEGDSAVSKSGTATITPGQTVVCRDERGKQDNKRSRAADAAVVNSAAEATACQRNITPVEITASPVMVHVEPTTPATETWKDRIGELSKGSSVTHNRIAVNSNTLQAELRSALCWVDRGLVSLFRALSSLHTPSSSPCTCMPSVDFRSHSSTSGQTQAVVADADKNTSDELTAESLTAALLLLTKAVKQSQRRQTDQVHRRRAIPQNDHSSCCTKDTVSATDEQLPAKRLHSSSPSDVRSDTLSFLATMLDELDCRQLQLLWQNRQCKEHRNKAATAEKQSAQKEDALEDDEDPVKTEATKEGLCASAPHALANRQNPVEARAGTDAIEVSRLHGPVSPSLLPTASAHDSADSLIDNEFAYALSSRVKEGGASVFFAPLHYQQDGGISYDDERMWHTEERQLKADSRVNGVFRGCDVLSQGTAAHLCLPVGECDVKRSTGNVDTASKESELIERLALEIVAQANNAAVLQDDNDALNMEWLQSNKQHCREKSGPHIPHDDYPGYMRNKECKQAESTETGDTWLREVARLFMGGGGDQDKHEKLKDLWLAALGGRSETTPRNVEAHEQYPTKCCSSEHLREHVRRICCQAASENTPLAQKHRSQFAGQHLRRGEELSSEELLLSSQDISEKGHTWVDGSVSIRDLTEREIDSSLRNPGFFEQRLEPKRQHRGDGYVASGKCKRSTGLENQCLVQEISQMTSMFVPSDDAVCDKRQAANVPATDRIGRALLHRADDTEGAASSAGNTLLHTDFSCVGEVSPEKRREVSCPFEVKKSTSYQLCTTGKVDFSSERREGEEHLRTKYIATRDAGNTRASASKRMREHDEPQDADTTEEYGSQKSPQDRETQHQPWTPDQPTEVRRNPPRSACFRSESSSSTIPKVSGVQRFTSSKHRSATKDLDKWTWEDAEDKENSRNAGSSRLARNKGNEIRSFAEEERSAQERQATGQAHFPRQRCAQTVETTEARSGDKGDEEPNCRIKRRTPGVESEKTGHGEHSVQSRRSSTQQSVAGTTVYSPGEEALRTVEATSRRASSGMYNDSGGRDVSWAEGNQNALPGHLDNADDLNAELDTRRPMRGVYFDRTQRSWIGSFYEDRRQIKKRFKVDTYGFLKAKALAVDVRLGYERRMLRGVVGAAAGCASPSVTESTAQLSSSGFARSDVSPSVQAEDNGEPEMAVVGDDGAEFWRRSVNKTSTEAQQQLPSLISQQRKGQQSTFTVTKNKSSPDAAREPDLQTNNDFWIRQDGLSSFVDTRPARDGNDSISAKERTDAMKTAHNEKQGENSVEWVEPDCVAREEHESSGSSLRSSSSYNSKTSKSYVSASGDLKEAALDGENARPCGGAADRQRIPHKGLQAEITLGDVESSSFVDRVDTQGIRRGGVDSRLSQVDVGSSSKIHPTELFSIQSTDLFLMKPTLCSGTSLKADDNESLSHSYFRKKTTTSSTGSTLSTQFEQEKQEKQNHQEGSFVEEEQEEEIKEADHFLTSETRADFPKTREETGRTWQRRAVLEGGCHAEVRNSVESKLLDIFRNEHVGEKMRSVPPQNTAARQQMEEDDIMQQRATLSDQYPHPCASLRRRNTPAPSAHFSIHCTVGTRTGVSSTEESRTSVAGSAENNLWHSHLKMGYLNENAERQPGRKEDPGVKNLEGGRRTSTSFVSTSVSSTSVPENVPLEEHPHGACDRTEPAMSLRRGKTPALLNCESIAPVERGCRNGSFSEPDASLCTAASVRESSCNRGCATEYWPIRPSTKRPADVASAAYMFSKRKKRPADIRHESGRGATPLLGHDLPLGVFYTNKKHAYCANWYEGKRQLKRYFPICKLGEPEARRLAIAARREAERREREARCRTGGSSFALPACTERRGFANAASADRKIPSDSGAATAVSPSVLGAGDASEDTYASQMEQR